MYSVTTRWLLPAVAGLILLGCDTAIEPSALTPVTSVSEEMPTPAEPARELTDVEWIESVLENLHMDPQKEFDLEALSQPSHSEFSAWIAESLIAAGFGDADGSIGIPLTDLMAGNPNLSLWFSEEFTKDVLEVSGETAQSPANIETEAGVLVPVVQSSTKMVSAQCRPEPANLCAFVLTVDWYQNELQGLLVLVSHMEDGIWNLRRYSPKDGSLHEVNTVEEYLSKIQMEQEETHKARCMVDPLSDEMGCTEALDLESMEQLVIHLCTTGAAEGTTLDQCAARFHQYCSNPQDSPYPQVQEQVCDNMAQAGYSLEDSEAGEEPAEEDQDLQEPELDEFADEFAGEMDEESGAEAF